MSLSNPAPEQEAAQRLEFLLLSRDPDSVLLGLELAHNPELALGQLTPLLAVALFSSDGKIRDLAKTALQTHGSASLFNHITKHWQGTHRKGKAAVFYRAVTAIGEHPQIEEDRLMKMAVRLTMKFPNGVAHEYPQAFAEWCQHRVFNRDTLHLDAYHIPHLPSSIGQFTELRELSLQHCQLKKLHPALSKLTQLQTLRLSHNQLEDLPDYLHRLPQLSDLQWDHNSIVAFPKVLNQLNGIRKLDLDLSELKNLDGLEKCSQLGWLQIKKAEQPSIPSEVLALTQLQSLEMCEADLLEVPEMLAAFHQLVELDLGGNDFNHFPAVLLRLPQLKALALGRLESVGSVSLKEMIHLQRLTLQCGFNAWPEAWCQLPEMLTLHLEDGLLEELPEAFSQLTSLGSLNLEKNKFSTWPDALSNMPDLMELGLHNNQLTEIPESIGQMTSLSVLDLSHNPLTTLPEAIFHLPRLSRLELGNTKLTRDLNLRLKKELKGVSLSFH